MFGWIALIVTLAAAWLGYGTARRFVRDRLRYVDAALKPSTPVIVGIAAALAAAPVVWLLPIIKGGTALVFGLAVGLGTRAGAADVKRGYLVSSGD
jgi:hypothetical protein